MIMRSPVLKIAVVLVLAIIPAQSWGMNWEGHDDWLEHQNHAQKLRSILPKPRTSDLQSCDDRRARAADNPYEQRALPGKNCYDTLLDDAELE